MLSAYSVPSAPGTTGAALQFDQNGASAGTAISHTAGSGDFTVSEPGVYTVNFHTNAAPTTGASFPLSVTLQLQQDGTAVPGAVVQHTFQEAGSSATLSFSIPVAVTSALSAFSVVSEGGGFLYSEAALSVYRAASA